MRDIQENPSASPTEPSATAKRILVVDDEDEIRNLVQRILIMGGYDVQSAMSGQEALERAQDFHPDLIVLDVSMPGMTGIEFCRHFRQFSNVPIVFLSALDDETTMLKGFDCGAVDYIVKPFKPRILLARVQLALRIGALLTSTPPTQFYGDGYLEIDVSSRRVTVEGESIALTATEFSVLLYLVQHAGMICSMEEILSAVWGEGYADASGHVYTYVRRLRQKLERDPHEPEYILSVHGVGYQFKRLVPPR